MKITIEPEKEENIKKQVYENVYEFALAGTHIFKELYCQPILRTHTGKNVNVLIGQLEQIKEELKDIKHANTSKR